MLLPLMAGLVTKELQKTLQGPLYFGIKRKGKHLQLKLKHKPFYLHSHKLPIGTGNLFFW